MEQKTNYNYVAPVSEIFLNMDNYRSTKETAKLFKVVTQTIKNWRRKGIIKPTKIGGRYFFSIAEINKMLGLGDKIITDIIQRIDECGK
jgi:transposase